MSVSIPRLHSIRPLLHRRPKLLFDHLPKCGGTSVCNILSANYRKSRTHLLNGEDPPSSLARFRALPAEKRDRIDLLMGHEAHQIRHDFAPQAVRLTILRDPIDRIASHYYHTLRHPEHYLHARVTGEGMSLRDYARSALSGELRNFYVMHFLEEPVEELEKSPETSVARALELLERDYAVVGFVDHLPAAFAQLRSQCGIRCPRKLPQLNASPRRERRERLDEQTRQTIGEVNSLDVRFYNALRARHGLRE